MHKPATPNDRKPYEPPRLVVYGTVRDLTQTVGPARTSDNGQFPHNRTGTG
jgi:hypothetical protein